MDVDVDAWDVEVVDDFGSAASIIAKIDLNAVPLVAVILFNTAIVLLYAKYLNVG